MRAVRVPRGARHELLAAGRQRGRPRASCRSSQNVAAAADRNGIRLYVTVMHPGSRTTPLTSEAQSGLRLVRRDDRPRGARSPQRHHRERAEPQPLLAPAVRARRVERGARGVSRAPRADLRRGQGRLPRRARLRRRRLPAGDGPAERHPPDALPHHLHPGARRRLPRERPHAARHGRVRDARVRGRLEHPADEGQPADDRDRRR